MAARPVIGISADEFARRAMTMAHGGDRAGALSLLEQGLGEHPEHPRLWHQSASLKLQTGDPLGAAENFGKAYALEPQKFDVAIDRAIALTVAGRNAEALDLLASVEALAGRQANFWSSRANAARGLGHYARAAEWYDKALAIEPARPKALHGRAAIALERGEPDAVARFDRALSARQNDPEIWLGKAQALDVDGRVDEARELAETLVDKLPQFAAALKFLAQLRLGAGEQDFTAHYRDATRRAPGDPNVYAEWALQLYGLDHKSQAAEVIANARRQFPKIDRFRILEAIYAGAAGEINRATELFADVPDDTEERWVHEGSLALRMGQYEKAETSFARAVRHNPDSISAWAYRGLLWRLTDDRRAEWLHGQQGLVRLLRLHDADEILPRVIPVLERLHDGSAMPLGQSLRGGTQTRGGLFDRTEPELAALYDAINSTLDEYRSELPEWDEAHPLLRHRNSAWRISGSWSVRLSGGGDHHTAHIHPQGIVSSALYCALPSSVTDQANRAGWIELGRPPPYLHIDLEPLTTLEPEVGYLALFPSTLYHGTRAFSDGRRMTVAFDVTTNRETMR